MSELENQYKVCMELIKQKKEVSETDILLTEMKDLLDKFFCLEEKKVEALKKKKRCPCFNFTSLHCCPVSLF